MPVRLIALLSGLFLCVAAHADSFISRLLDKPVPGGVAVVALGESAQAPAASFDGKPVMVLRDDQAGWIAVVGIPLSAKPGRHAIQVRSTSGEQDKSFEVSSKRYTEQHIKLKNTRQVNPNPDDLKRIERELAEQVAAYRTFSAGTPSNVLFDKPVDGRLSSPFGLQRF